ncbi:hypothetical protein HDU82_004515 [Entophlyctis luteolus]|nr:hypothetical protein HDU82_004515 [Entophlyctis luteolus]
MVSTRKRTGATASNATDQPRAQGALAHDHEHAHAHAHSHAHVTAADAEDGNTSKKRRVDAPASAAVVESALSEDEMALYDRQIRLWGLEAQTKMRSARVLVVGMTGIANEICKNITLAGIGNLTLMDSRNVEPSDLGAQFLLAESDIGTNIAVAAAGRIRLLNPRVHINILVDEVSSKQEEFYRDFEIVVVTSKLAFSTMFLAGGYGSRLQRDIDNDTSGRYSHLKGVSKALLPLRGTPLISHWITLLNAWNVEEKSDAFSGFEPLVICNASNHEQFKEWARTTGFKEASIFNDGTTSNEGRHGAVTDLSLAISYFNLQDPSKFKAVLVVAGDTLFLKDFSLKQFVTLAISMGEARKGDKAPCLVASYTVLRDIDTLKTGIIETDDTDSLRGGGAEGRRVTSLIEKPDPSETTSRLACPCFYYLSSDSVGLVGQFVKASVSRGEPMEKRDATGRFIEWLVRVHPVYTTSVSGRLDIGGLASYIEAEEYLSDANSKRPELRQLGDETKSASIALKLVSSKSGSSISTSVVSKVQKSMLRVPATPRLCALFSSSASAASAASAPSRTAPDLRSIAFDATAGVPVEAGSAHAARAALLAAALPLVPELGFSDSALRAAARSLSLSPIAAGLCTRGPVELAEFLVTETTSAVSQQMRAAPEFEK